MTTDAHLWAIGYSEMDRAYQALDELTRHCPTSTICARSSERSRAGDLH